MNSPLLRRALRRSLNQVRYVSPVRPAAAKGLVATVYQQVERDFGMLAPPVALHSPAPGPLAACWLMLRETLVVPGTADRAAKEAVAAAVSLGNACPYCVAVHTAAVRTLFREPAAAEIAEDRIAEIPDPRLRAVATWARTSGLHDHAPASDEPFPAEQAPELVGVAVTFHYLNRMVNVFLDDSPLPPTVPPAAARVLMAILGRLMVSAGPVGPVGPAGPADHASPADPAGLAGPAGPADPADPVGPAGTAGPADPASVAGPASVADPAGTVGPAADGLLPVAELPGDLPWTCCSPRIASAFARAAAAIDRAGSDAVPPRVRELVLDELAGWDGHPRGPSRSWAAAAASRLAEADRPAGRLALLTAFSAYQVTEQDIEDFRRGGPDDGGPDDEALVGLTSWASFAAARRIGTWLGLFSTWLGLRGGEHGLPLTRCARVRPIALRAAPGYAMAPPPSRNSARNGAVTVALAYPEGPLRTRSDRSDGAIAAARRA